MVKEPSIVTRQPVKGLYALLATLLGLARYPFWVISYQFPSPRPDPQWTLRQALGTRIAKTIAYHMSIVRKRTSLDLKPGKEGKRFVVIGPHGQDGKMYQGAALDSEIKPVKIGATWHPEPLTKAGEDVEVILHFHGGAYVYGNGRDYEMAFPASQFIQHGRATHAVFPAYRLSSHPGGRFPAALQDAVTSYLHLVKTLKVPASKITISGDSAGGNLTMCLLRYIHDHGEELDIPWPACVWLWSPWPNVYACLDMKYFSRQPNFRIDFVGPEFGYWGASTVVGDYTGPYLDPLNNAFKSKSPIFVHGGAVEVISEDIIQMAKNFETVGNTVELMMQAHCPHDVLASGDQLGFSKEAAICTKVAGEFLRANRLESQ